MAFSNVWDNTTPANSQAASQGADDFRTLKTDVQQRMAAISGTDAAKQSFEAGFAGVIYFATDTGFIYRWSGAAWVDITADFFTGGTQQSYEALGTILDGSVSLTIPSAKLLANKRVHITGLVKAPAGGIPDATNLEINAGINFLAISEAVAGNAYLWFEANIFLRNPNLYDTIGKSTYLTNAAGAAVRETMRYLVNVNSVDFAANDMTIFLADAANTVVSQVVLMATVI